MNAAESAPGLWPVLRVRQLHKRFGDLEVLQGIDLDVFPGEVLVIIGPSGSGKSTFLRCLNLLEEPTAGEIWVDDTLITARRVPQHLVRRKLGMVFQQFNLFPHLTVLQNIIEAPVRVAHLPVATAMARAEGLLRQVDLLDKKDAYPAQLSGGQQQRVAIARALAMNPKIMLFDEPTSALDPELIGEVLGVMKDLALSGMTMVVVTHEMHFARDVADRMAYMEGGIIQEIGPARTLIDSPQSPRLKGFLRHLH